MQKVLISKYRIMILRLELIKMPYRTPKHVQEKKDEKKQHILDMSLQLFAEKGFANTLIQDICKAAGVSVGSMYFYFSSKEEVYEAVYSRLSTDYDRRIKEAMSSVSSLKEILRRLVEIAVHSAVPNIYETQFFLMNSNLENLKMKRDDSLRHFTHWFKTILDDATQKGEITPQNTELAAANFTYGTYQSIRYWNVYQLEISPEEMIDVLYHYHLKGLGVRMTKEGEGK